MKNPFILTVICIILIMLAGLTISYYPALRLWLFFLVVIPSCFALAGLAFVIVVSNTNKPR